MSKGRRKSKPLTPGLSLSRRHAMRRLILWILSVAVVASLTYLTALYIMKRQADDGGRQTNIAAEVTNQAEAEADSSKAPAEEPRVRSLQEPHGLSIPTLGIDGARVESVGVEPSGEMAAPRTNQGVGWYRDSDSPGGGGALLMNGHVGLENESAVFSKLHQLARGDEIVVEDGRGESYSYMVYHVEQLPTKEVDMRKMMRSVDPARQGLNIITCAGAFVESANTYTDRVLVYAVLAKG